MSAAQEPFTGTPNTKIARQDERGEARDADQDVGKLLAEQEFDARHRSRAEVGDRAGLHLAHDAERRHDGGDEDQHHHDGAGHLRINALERLIVAVALLHIDQRERRGLAGQARRQVGEIALHHAAEIAARRLGPERHVAADPGADLRSLLSDQIVAEVRRDLDGEFELPAAQAGHDLIGGREVWLPVEVFRVLEAVQELPALERPVLIEDRPAQMLDVERNTVADGEHQDDRIEERKGDPHRIAHDLHRLPARVGPEPRNAEAALARFRRREDLCLGRRRRFGRFLALVGDAGRILEKLDERLLERLRVTSCDQLRRRAGGQDLAGVHERDTVATHRLVHEVRGKKDRHPVVAGESNQVFPEPVARDRIDARRRLVQDQHLGAMLDGHRQLQALTDAERKALRFGVGHLPEPEPV